METRFMFFKEDNMVLNLESIVAVDGNDEDEVYFFTSSCEDYEDYSYSSEFVSYEQVVEMIDGKLNYMNVAFKKDKYLSIKRARLLVNIHEIEGVYLNDDKKTAITFKNGLELPVRKTPFRELSQAIINLEKLDLNLMEI